MAVRSVATTDTLETFRTTFNSLAATDIGDKASLSTTEKGSIVGAINEINTSVTATGFILEDDSSTTQTIVSGNTLKVSSGSGINAVVSATDTLTISVAGGDISQNVYFDHIGVQYNADGSNTYTELVVTKVTKTSAHIYNGQGSSNGYKIDGVEAPFLNMKVGNTYRFNQADSSNDGHPLRFYYDKDKTTIYSTGVTTNGTPGNSGAYTQIVVSETTPNILYYQCSSHNLMGSRIDIPSSTSVIATSTAFVDSTGTAITFASQAFSIAQAVALG
tara:strand:+ start:134 stop:958 length:825 start_codon:yes stop_codon:yes gene_type:complete